MKIGFLFIIRQCFPLSSRSSNGLSPPSAHLPKWYTNIAVSREEYVPKKVTRHPLFGISLRSRGQIETRQHPVAKSVRSLLLAKAAVRRIDCSTSGINIPPNGRKVARSGMRETTAPQAPHEQLLKYRPPSHKPLPTASHMKIIRPAGKP